MTITALPTPPTRQDPLNFANRADAFLAALPQFGTEANALAAAVNADEIAAAASAAAALASQNAAASSASAAAGSAASAQSAANSVAAIEQRYLGAKTADPTLDNQGGPLQEGMLYFNTNTDLMRVYNGIAWQDVSSSVSTPFQVFNGNGSQTAFTLSGAPGSVGSIDVFISGVRQLPTTHYSVSGTTLTFVTAPPAGTANIFARWITTQGVGVPADKSVTYSKIQDVTSQRLLGRGEATAGDVREVQVGSGLSLSNSNVLDNPSAFGLPLSNTTGTLVATDAGDILLLTSTITIPSGVFSTGQTVTLYNNTAGNITITQGASLTLRQVGTANVGNRTLAQRGLATVVFISSTEAVISGGGLS